MSESNEAPRILIARGTPEAVERAAKVLSQLDIEVGYVQPEQHTQIDNILETLRTPGYYRFSEITSPEQWLGREHVLAFHRRFAPDYDKKIPSIAYNALVAPAVRSKDPGRGKHSRPIDPDHITKSLGLVVASRKRINFPPLSDIHHNANTPTESVKRAVNVGSLFSFYALLEDSPKLAARLHGFHKPDSFNRQFLKQLVTQLKTQVHGNSSA